MYNCFCLLGIRYLNSIGFDTFTIETRHSYARDAARAFVQVTVLVGGCVDPAEPPGGLPRQTFDTTMSTGTANEASRMNRERERERSEARDRKREIGSQRSEERDRKPEIGRERSEARDQKRDIGTTLSEERGRNINIGRERSEEREREREREIVAEQHLHKGRSHTQQLSWGKIRDRVGDRAGNRA